MDGSTEIKSGERKGKKTMNTYENKEHDVAVNADDFLGGNYLKKEDLDGPTIATVENVWSEAVIGASRRKMVVSFQEIEKPLILNKTNIRRLVRIFGSTETGSWKGKVTLYVELNVEYGGRVVGGIRVRPARSEQRPANNGQATERFDEGDIEFDGF